MKIQCLDFEDIFIFYNFRNFWDMHCCNHRIAWNVCVVDAVDRWYSEISDYSFSVTGRYKILFNNSV